MAKGSTDFENPKANVFDVVTDHQKEALEALSGGFGLVALPAS